MGDGDCSSAASRCSLAEGLASAASGKALVLASNLSLTTDIDLPTGITVCSAQGAPTGGYEVAGSSAELRYDQSASFKNVRLGAKVDSQTGSYSGALKFEDVIFSGNFGLEVPAAQNGGSIEILNSQLPFFWAPQGGASGVRAKIRIDNSVLTGALNGYPSLRANQTVDGELDLTVTNSVLRRDDATTDRLVNLFAQSDGVIRARFANNQFNHLSADDGFQFINFSAFFASEIAVTFQNNQIQGGSSATAQVLRLDPFLTGAKICFNASGNTRTGNGAVWLIKKNSGTTVDVTQSSESNLFGTANTGFTAEYEENGGALNFGQPACTLPLLP